MRLADRRPSRWWGTTRQWAFRVFGMNYPRAISTLVCLSAMPDVLVQCYNGVSLGEGKSRKHTHDWGATASINVRIKTKDKHFLIHMGKFPGGSALRENREKTIIHGQFKKVGTQECRVEFGYPWKYSNVRFL